MIFNTKLYPATLLKRYKRFLADVRFDDGSIETVYCPNTGSMKSCSSPGSEVYLSLSKNSNRKYRFTLEIVCQKKCLVGVNTALTNTIVAEAIADGQIAELAGFDTLHREVTVSPRSRLDMMLEKEGRKIYIEVKNCTLVEDGLAMFPDAVTLRGAKHLHELADLTSQGHEAIIFFLVQRTDAAAFKPAEDIDPYYAEVLYHVYSQGVRVMIYQAEVTPEAIRITERLPFIYNGSKIL